jgi:hypothetical protein
MILCEWDAPEGHPGQCCYTCMLVSYRRLSPQFQFSLSLHPIQPSWYSSVSISVSILYVDFGKGGGVAEVNQREGRGAIVHKAGLQIPT